MRSKSFLLRYSTFTILHLQSNQTAELIQFDNPLAVLIREGNNVDYPRTEINVDRKRIYRSVIRLQEEDVFLLMSDGCPHDFFVGRAINPAHQDPRLPINFSIKMNLVKELSACLEQMGKRIKVSYF